MANLKIGGRNLLRHTDIPEIGSSNRYEQWLVQSGGNGTGVIVDISDSPVPSVTRGFRINGNTSGNRDFVQRNKTIEGSVGDTFMFSTWVRGIGGTVTALVRAWNNTQSNAAFDKRFSVSSEWTYVSFEFKTSSGAVNGDIIDARFGITGAGSIEYIAPKLERGNKATD